MKPDEAAARLRPVQDAFERDYLRGCEMAAELHRDALEAIRDELADELQRDEPEAIRDSAKEAMTIAAIVLLTESYRVMR